jgi:small subunit ribosomal protein S5
MKKKEIAVKKVIGIGSEIEEIIIEPEIEEIIIEPEIKEAVAEPEVRKRFGRMSEEEIIAERLGSWKPRTDLGKLVKDKKIKHIDEILEKGKKILEDEIVDSLLKVESELLFAGQSKGKFGGGKRRAWRQAQKKTKEGNIITFSSLIVVGDKNGHIGLGFGKAKETLPAREKALRDAKKNIFKIKRGSGSFEGKSEKPHSIPFKVSGKCGSCSIILIPAPQGTGLVIGKEGKKILRLAGIEDVYTQSKGKTRTTLNYAKAIINALKKLK